MASSSSRSQALAGYPRRSPFGRVRLELYAALRACVHARVEQRVAVLSGCLGGVKGQVSVAQQGIWGLVLPHRHPDARRHREELAGIVELDRLTQDLGH